MPAFEQLFALYDYQQPFVDVIQALKFRKLSYLADEMAKLLWDRHAEQLSCADIVVPIPLPWPRLIQRGFNQAEAIAYPLAKRLDRQVQLPLRRTMGPPQSAIKEQVHRKRNVRRTLRLRRRFQKKTTSLRGMHVLLVDDLVTSGATAHQASILLRRAGARRITVAAAGHLL